MHYPILFVALLIVVLLLNVLVSIAVFRSGTYSAGQATAQAAIVWLVPLIGTLLVGLFLWSERSAGAQRGIGGDHENWQNAGDGPHGGHHGP